MRSLLAISFIALLAGGLISCNNTSNKKNSDENASTQKMTREDLGWELGTQAYTFHQFTFFEAIDKTKALGLHFIEAYPGQKIGGGIDGVMNYDIDNATRQKIKDYLKKQDITLEAFGVIVPNTKAQWDSLFAFAKDMGIKNIVSQPKVEDLPYISKLCDQYKINVAIHNHPKPSYYWSPDTLLAAISGLSNRIGSCFDVGHFTRSGLNALESLKKLKGHVIEFHFKDVASESPKTEDTIWGTGVCDVPGIIKEMRKQHFKGLISIEYEAHPEDNMNQIKKSIQFFDKEVARLPEDNKE